VSGIIEKTVIFNQKTLRGAKAMIRDLDLTNKFSELYEKPVFLYGGGYNGKIAVRLLNIFGIEPVAFGDSNSALKGDIIEGIPVKSLDEIIDIAGRRKIIIIITTTSRYYESVISVLFKNNIQCDQIYTYTAFLYAAHFNMEKYGRDITLHRLKNVWLHNQRLIRNREQGEVNIYKLLLNSVEETPIIIYQPGKVGSNTVANSLRACGTEVIRLHGIEYSSMLDQDFELRQCFIECVKRARKVKMITLFREPVSKDIGHFFQKIDIEESDIGWIIKGLLEKNFQQSFLNYLSVVTPFDFTVQNKKDKISKEVICHIDAIGQRSKYGALWGWFDEELNKNFGIDILSKEFDTDKGYTIIESGNIELLIMKMEKLNSLEEVIRDFTGNSMFKITSVNQAETKSYRYAYKQFQDEVVLPREYVDFYYKDNPYINHFYSREERELYYEKWEKHIIENI